jgi:site-specific DNA-methyltransferase (adenine-specific)
MAVSEVYLMDCMELMRQYPDKHFNLAVVDPPYKEDVSGLSVGYNKKQDRRDFNYKTFKPPTKEYIAELFRVSENQILWGFNYYLELLPNTDACVFWNKHQNGHFSEGELAWCSLGKTRYYDRAFGKDLFNKIHPTQKPVALYSWIFKNYAKPGDLILDTHLGSGSSRIAADKAGLDFIACEIDKDYFEAQEKRFRQYKAQLKLFG